MLVMVCMRIGCSALVVAVNCSSCVFSSSAAACSCSFSSSSSICTIFGVVLLVQKYGDVY